METLWQDLKYGARMLLKNRGVTLIAVLTLALGIGANTSIFSIVNAVLFRSLPYKDSNQIVVAYVKTRQSPRDFVSYPDYRDWRQQSQSFAELAGWVPQSVNWTGTEQPTRVIGAFVSENFFSMLGVQPAMGRDFRSGETEPGAPENVVVFSHAFWLNQLGADPAVVGKPFTFNGEVFTAAGVMPADYHFVWSDSDVYLPLHKYPNFTTDRLKAAQGVIGRMKPGVRLEQAQAEMDTIASRLAQQYPDSNAGRGVTLVRFPDLVVEDLKPMLFVLFGAVGLVLLIACANVANLLLVRATVRQKEFALRAALGAGRARIARQLLTEAVLLWLIGGALGLLAGRWGMDALAAIRPGDLPPGIFLNIDANVLAFTAAVTALTGILFGLAPALHFARPDVNEALKEGGRTIGAGSGRGRLRAALMIFQVAVALLLLVGSGLLLKSFARVLHVNPGFNSENLLTMEYRVPRNKYPEGPQQWAFHQQVVERVRELPGVRSVAVIMALPFSGNGGTANFVLLDRAAPEPGKEPRAQINRAHPETFRTLGIPLVRGRVINEQDTAQAPPVIVVNQLMARKYWGSDDPLGKQIKFVPGGEVATIVGVVGDIKQYMLEDPSVAQIWTAYAQNPHIFATLAVRTSGDAMNMANAVRSAVWTVDKDQPVWKVRTMEMLLDRAVGQRRFVLQLLGAYSGVALLLAAIGIYGVIAYSFSQRTHEIGIRLALGAQARDVLAMVLRQGLRLTLLGVAAGLVAAFALTRWMEKLLFDVKATDPLTYAGVGVLLTAVALAACWVPARRASRVDPMVALRYE
ncbi:MAG TPA: ABC transporter permease [Candidatus Acidoferrales bacterium]|jgi:putative ABC transport system permease protein|nr:ABC transporter permease [Candidatus Acidoferrales bacterium]